MQQDIIKVYLENVTFLNNLQSDKLRDVLQYNINKYDITENKKITTGK